jgi:hypothetical protein
LEQGISKGIEGVMVSNGEAVVRADAEGRYSIAVAPGHSVFVIKPPGFALPVEPSTMLPRFAHVYFPEGTPADRRFRFPGIAPTQALPESLDFTLTRDRASQKRARPVVPHYLRAVAMRKTRCPPPALWRTSSPVVRARSSRWRSGAAPSHR